MQQAINPSSIETIDGWTFRIQPPKTEGGNRLILLIHGWTGDEQVMNIFARRLDGHYWVFFPRGPVVAPQGGFGWAPHGEELASQTPFLVDNAKKLLLSFKDLLQQKRITFTPPDLMGFSQGAALAYTLAACEPTQTGKVAALSGFFPNDLDKYCSLEALKGKSFYVTHGRMDETLPVDEGRKAVALLKEVKADVTYCESNATHKVDANCFNDLSIFFN
jgi:phospholipase/carboxylesterase